MPRMVAGGLAVAGCLALSFPPPAVADTRRGPGHVAYDVALSWHAHDRRLDGTERVSFENTRGRRIRSVWVRLWANGVASCGHPRISAKVLAGGHAAGSAAACTALKVRLARDLPSGKRAAIRLRFSGKKTMKIAQELYEGIEVDGTGPVGLITYMRTDSLRVSDDAVSAVRAMIASEYGDRYLARPAAIAARAHGCDGDARRGVRVYGRVRARAADPGCHARPDGEHPGPGVTGRQLTVAVPLVVHEGVRGPRVDMNLVRLAVLQELRLQLANGFNRDPLVRLTVGSKNRARHLRNNINRRNRLAIRERPIDG